MGIRNFPVITIGQLKGTIEYATVASFVAIPVMSNGALPKFLYVLCQGGSLNTRVLISPSNVSSAGDADDGFAMDCDFPHPIILNVHGYSVIRYSRLGGGTSVIWMYPLEDF